MSKRTKLIIGAVLAVAVVGVVVYFGLQYLNKTNTSQSSNKKLISSIDVSMPKGWQGLAVPVNEQKAGVLAKYQKNNDRHTTMLIRTVFGELSGDFDINKLPGDLVARFKQDVPKFTLVSQNVGKIGAYNVAQLRYTEKPKDDRVFENVLAVVPLQSQTFDVVFRAPRTKFDQIESDIPKVLDAFTSYIQSKS